mgnify:CR=1 FL=1
MQVSDAAEMMFLMHASSCSGTLASSAPVGALATCWHDTKKGRWRLLCTPTLYTPEPTACHHPANTAACHSQEADRASLSQQAEAQLEALRARHQAALAGLTAQQAQSAGQAAELQRQLAAAQAEAEGLRR